MRVGGPDLTCLVCNGSPDVLTSSLVENGEARRRVGSVPQPDGPVSGAGEEAVVSSAVDHAPHRVRVTAQRPPQDRGLYSRPQSEHAGAQEAVLTRRRGLPYES